MNFADHHEKLNSVSEAKMQLDQKEIDKIAKMTSRNDHMGALIAGANLLGLKKLSKIFKAISDIHSIEGHLHGHIYEYRHIKYEELMDYAKSTLNEIEYRRFYSAF